MTHEFEVGDRFTLEFEVTGWSEEWVECKTMGSTRRAFPPSDMRHAKLIQGAAPEPQKLDTSKSMRLLGSDEASFTFLQRATNGMLIIKWDSGSLDILEESEVENIPEPKQITTQIVELVPFSFGPRIMMKSDLAHYMNVASRAKVTYTEGEGWSICEEES